MLTAETAIIARLKAQLPVTTPPTNVTSSASIADTMDVAPLCPMVVVHPGQCDKAERESEDLLTETQTWRVAVYMKNVPDTRGFASDFQAAGALMQNIVLALDGWEPGADFNRVRYTGRPDPIVGNGFTQFEMQFAARFALSIVPAAPTPDSFVTFDEKYDIDTSQTGEPVAEDNITLPQ